MSKDVRQLYYLILKRKFKPHHVNYLENSIEIVFRFILFYESKNIGRFNDISFELRTQ